jgi:hypothetical protein
MTEKRFTVDDGLENVLCWEINDKENEGMTCGECAKLLNDLLEENEQLKQDKTNLHRAMSRDRVRYNQFKDKVLCCIDGKIKLLKDCCMSNEVRILEDLREEIISDDD